MVSLCCDRSRPLLLRTLTIAGQLLQSGIGISPVYTKPSLIIVAALAAIISSHSVVQAASVSKPAVTAYGKYCRTGAKAKQSAQGRWGLKAVAKYGASYGL